MDVRKQGLTMLYLRLVSMSTPERKRSASNYMDKWVAQVKIAELAKETAEQGPPSKIIRCR